MSREADGTMFGTVLIANRGEIGLRVARTCREMGIRTVVVYSSADRDTPLTRFADEAVHIGPPAAKSSYLNIPAIIEAALRTGSEAIHPGYGFLSEDPDFAEICSAHDITFIGPAPEVMARLGDKATARTIMAAAGLPVVEGSESTLDTAAQAKAVADRIGYPVIIKATAGGGGRGMRVVGRPSAFVRAYSEARSHAHAVFGDSRVYVERFVERARHVEVQVVRDRFGNAVHFGTRDCSVQRNNQKLVEETPAPRLPAELVDRMTALAVLGAHAVGYEGACTFEFLLDDAGRFHFMEINCRIQVEHPVTEMVTGTDLVREQIMVAAGRPLSLRQADVVLSGAAVECRINTEDPYRGFRPTPGRLEEFRLPGGPFTRVDSHGAQGAVMTSEYDSLLAKIVVWAPDREQAVARMSRALNELHVTGPGVRTTKPFLQDVLAHPLFKDATHTTGLVEHMLETR
ncbi:acetyl-CoA carboxylase biotin carboxylase subunit [Sphaerisporangium sp. TRM90804]|uniref:acetyl-CoA carboxylase biotin carboxylase subunit n=1 Tax=Sphaerisporangium sp. TRM90804 TaxID=3031113 RepID=UPI002447A5B8|nr:acetyl-CoA carboxylase biotin carboxylase subunit [Sphaerisporangium sp. TRM90804]MDH2427217.1 acetyl-CoA carboxylase biotin carboxylase subunit [Sphaerisporangium sp. TRM90804]